jgi:hypothetical protein
MTKFDRSVQSELMRLWKVMDTQEAFFKELGIYEEKPEGIPAEYKSNPKVMAAYNDYKKNGPWRKRAKIRKVLYKAAVKCAKTAKKKYAKTSQKELDNMT